MSGGGGQNPRLNAPSFHPAPNQYGAPIAPRPYAPPPTSTARQSRLAASGDTAWQFRSTPRPPQNPQPCGQNPHLHAPNHPNQNGNPALQFLQSSQSHMLHRPQFGQPPSQSHAPPPNTAFGVRPGPPPQHPPPPFGQTPAQSHVPPPYATFGVRPAPPPQHPLPPPLPPGKRRLEDEERSDSGRIKRVTRLVTYVPVLEFLAKYPATEPYQFKVGSSFGNIPKVQRTKITRTGASVLDGFVEFCFGAHEVNRSFGGDFDVTDMLVSEQAPYHVTIQKQPSMSATKLNICNDLEKLVNNLVMVTYGKDGNRPAYLEDFVAWVKKLRSETTPKQWHVQLWIIRNHPLFVQSGKRRLFLEDFYKFYKTLDCKAAAKLFKEISTKLYARWHVLIAPKDNFISTVYWKGREGLCPEDHFEIDYIENSWAEEESPDFFPFTSEHGYIAVFLRHLIVHGPEEALFFPHGPEEALWFGIELEELELIIAYYFGEFLSTFLSEILGIAYRYDMVREILAVYADRRSVCLQVPG